MVTYATIPTNVPKKKVSEASPGEMFADPHQPGTVYIVAKPPVATFGKSVLNVGVPVFNLWTNSWTYVRPELEITPIKPIAVDSLGQVQFG